MPSTSTTKKFVFAFDIICSILALVLIAFGIYILCAYDISDHGAVAAYAYIGVGVAALIMFVYGSLAALREHVCCTITFITLLWVVILVQAAVIFLLTMYEKQVASNLANTVDTTWDEELESPGAMSIYENWFNCCGRASPQDYIVNERLPPETCFRNGDNSNSWNLFVTGCRVEFENYILKLLRIFNIIAWIMIALEFLGSLVACCLCQGIRNDRRRSYF